MHESLWEQATESDWPEEERRQWYRERPRDEEYYRIQRELLREGLTRKAKLTQLPPHHSGPSASRASPPCGSPLYVSLAFDDELTEQQKRDLEEEWGEERETTLQFHKGPRLQLLWPATAVAHQLRWTNGDAKASA